MSDKYIEKIFLYLLALSFLLHLAIFEVISRLPPEKGKPEQTTMVDLTDLPAPPPPPRPKSQPRPNLRSAPEPKPVDRLADRRQRVPKEMSPKASRDQERLAPSQPLPPAKTERAPIQGKLRSAPGVPDKSVPLPRGEGLFKPKGSDTSERSRLFPSAKNLARLEESYRQEYRDDVAKGDTQFINTDDIQFGSFMRRLENAVYGAWRYPEEALRRGIEGTTPVKITFSRSGEILRIDLLDTSGSRILDDEVIRTLKQLGPIGPLPKAYPNDTFKLIAFFHYGIGGVYRIH